MRFPCYLFVLAPLLCLGSVVGCQRAAAPQATTTKTSERQATSQQTALLRSIRKQLRTLPESADLVLRPPMVVLDKRSTRDGEDIQAVLQRAPGVVDGPANVMVAKVGGVNFRDKVRPGDIVKYYASYDKQTLDRLRQSGDVGIATFEATELKVAQVVSNDSLMIEGGIADEWNIPSRLEIWRIADDRMNKIQRELGAYVVKRDPPLAWHPSPDAGTISQLTERLNQWLRQSKLAGSKAPAAADKNRELLETLPSELANNPELSTYLDQKNLGTGYFSDYEVRQVQGAIWRRDVSRWARGPDTGTMAVAQSLFDWTIRNLQLIEDDKAPPRWPWEMMLHGRATAAGRAWVFAGLCEQQNLTAAIVTLPVEGDADRTLVGVLDRGTLRLFDPALGSPMLAADGVTIVSLAQILGDGQELRRADLEQLLQQFDLPEMPDPATSESAKQVRVQLVASPLALARRAEALESQLSAEDSVTLHVDLDATAERLKAVRSVSQVSFWPMPVQTLLNKLTVKRSFRNEAVRDFLPYAWRPALWRARTQHFRGNAATAKEQAATTNETADDHRDARRYYTSPRVRPTNRQLATLPEEKQVIYGAAKIAATFNLGVLTYEEGNYEVAKNWFENATLNSEAASEYQSAVQYNLARTYVKLGEKKQAIDLLNEIEGPAAEGAKLLAKQLTAPEVSKEAASSEGEEARSEEAPTTEQEAPDKESSVEESPVKETATEASDE